MLYYVVVQRQGVYIHLMAMGDRANIVLWPLLLPGDTGVVWSRSSGGMRRYMAKATAMARLTASSSHQQRGCDGP